MRNHGYSLFYRPVRPLPSPPPHLPLNLSCDRTPDRPCSTVRFAFESPGPDAQGDKHWWCRGRCSDLQECFGRTHVARGVDANRAPGIVRCISRGYTEGGPALLLICPTVYLLLWFPGRPPAVLCSLDRENGAAAPSSPERESSRIVCPQQHSHRKYSQIPALKATQSFQSNQTESTERSAAFHSEMASSP